MFASPQSQSGSGKDLQILSTCPLCHAQYNPLKTQIVAERDDAHLLYLECRHCGSAVVALVTTGAAGLRSIGVVTDLTSREIATNPGSGEVTHDDVIAMYDWLEREERLPQTLTNFISR